MANEEKSQYGLLLQDGDCEDADQVYRGANSKRSLPSWLLALNSILALAVVGLAAYILSRPQPHGSTTAADYHGTGPVRLLDDQHGFTSKVVKTYQFYEDNLDDYDFSKGDPYWAALFPKGDGQLFLEDDVVAAYKLPPTLRVPEKGNLSAYMMAGYHSLHCLAAVRLVIGRFMIAHRAGEQWNLTDSMFTHAVHCLSDLRQVLFCNFDETLLVLSDVIHPGYQQKKVCKDLDPIVDWLEYHYEGKFAGV